MSRTYACARNAQHGVGKENEPPEKYWQQSPNSAAIKRIVARYACVIPAMPAWPWNISTTNHRVENRLQVRRQQMSHVKSAGKVAGELPNKKSTVETKHLLPAETWVLYILRCGTGRGIYYTGITNNLTRRMEQHRTKRGAKYTRRYWPYIQLWFSVTCYDKAEAEELERKVKRLRRDKKEEFMSLEGKTWRTLVHHVRFATLHYALCEMQKKKMYVKRELNPIGL